MRLSASNMKQIARQVTSFVLAFILLATPVCLPLVSCISTIVKVEPATGSVAVGDVFTVNTTIVDVQNLYGIEVALSWDSSILRVIDVDVRFGQLDGVLLDPIFVAQNVTDQQHGNYFLAATSISPALPFNGSGNVVRITFSATGVGTSSLNLTSKLYDYPPPDRWPRVSLPIDHITIDGSFIIIPEFTSVIVLLAFMALASLIPILSRRRSKNTPGMVRSHRSEQGLLAEGCVTTWSSEK